MRLVFVNHCHPETPHVCAIRMREFAAAMAGRGHQVVLVTSSLGDRPGTGLPGNLGAALAAHDWTRPFLLETPPSGFSAIARARQHGIGYGIGKVLLAASYFCGSGVYPDWRAAVRPHLQILARGFRPEAVWGTFGNTSSWVIARDIARAAGCPWVADLKDHWESFIPRQFRSLLAGRFADAAAMTAFSGEHRDTVQRWFDRDAAVVYSGVDPALFRTVAAPGGDVVTLTGAIYDRASLDGLIGGIRFFAESLPEMRRAKLLFRYAGHDRAEVEAASAALDGLVACDIRGQQPLADWAGILSGARVNCYVKSGVTFHHKLFDLLAAGVPVLTLPPETGEAMEIADAVVGTLLGAHDPAGVADILKRVVGEPAGRNETAADSLSWAGRAGALEAVLQSVIGEAA